MIANYRTAKKLMEACLSAPEPDELSNDDYDYDDDDDEDDEEEEYDLPSNSVIQTARSGSAKRARMNEYTTPYP